MNWRAIGAFVMSHLADPMNPDSQDCDAHERFALPFKFQPRLRVSDALRFALRSLLRILLGSTLFGAWGALTLLAWTSIGNVYLRTAAVIPMFALFLALLAGLMIATSRLLPRRLPR